MVREIWRRKPAKKHEVAGSAKLPAPLTPALSSPLLAAASHRRPEERETGSVQLLFFGNLISLPSLAANATRGWVAIRADGGILPRRRGDTEQADIY